MRHRQSRHARSKGRAGAVFAKHAVDNVPPHEQRSNPPDEAPSTCACAELSGQRQSDRGFATEQR